MNAFQFLRAFETLTPEKLEELAVDSVLKNSDQVEFDSIRANDNELTFSGTSIKRIKPFTDWSETGDYHKNLQFIPGNKDIEFISYGDGSDAITRAFNEDEYIAPHANTLSASTISVIKNDFINNIKAEIK